MNWRQVLGNLQSLLAENYRYGTPEANCERCVFFAKYPAQGYPTENVRGGVCGKHNVRVSPDMLCDDFKLVDEMAKVI